MMKLGYQIAQEIIVLERGIFYVIMKWIKGTTHYSHFDCYFGPYLRRNDIPLREEYRNYLWQQNETILKQLPKNAWLEKRKRKHRQRLLKKIKSTSIRST